MKNIDQLQIFYAEFEKSVSVGCRSLLTLNNYKLILNNLSNWENVDELLNQINFLLNSKKNLSTNTLFGVRAVYKAFCEWFAKRNNVYIPFNERVYKYKLERGTRRSYTKEELEILLDELKNFDNCKFEIVFKILLTTGIRVSEWEYINWNSLKENNYEIIIKTAKNNNPRPFKIADTNYEMFKDIKLAVENGLNLKIKAKTIKNLFILFKKFILHKYPNFKNKISAHILRHTFVTLASEHSTIEEISKILGHVNSNTTASTYLTYNPIIANKKLGKMQNNIINFVSTNDYLTEEEKLALENKKLKTEIEALKEQIKEQNAKSIYSFAIFNNDLAKHKD